MKFPFINTAHAAGAGGAARFEGKNFFDIFKELVNTAAQPLFGQAYTPFPQGNVPQDLQIILIATKVITIVISFAGIIFLAFLVFAGYQWMTAGGNEEQLEKAQSRIKNAIIGLIVIVFAFMISYVLSYYVISLMVEPSPVL